MALKLGRFLLLAGKLGSLIYAARVRPATDGLGCVTKQSGCSDKGCTKMYNNLKSCQQQILNCICIESL